VLCRESSSSSSSSLALSNVAAVRLLQQLSALHSSGRVGPADPQLVGLLLEGHVVLQECSLEGERRTLPSPLFQHPSTYSAMHASLPPSPAELAPLLLTYALLRRCTDRYSPHEPLDPLWVAQLFS
jgi:hypothetical protein